MPARLIRGWTPLAVPGTPTVSVAVATFEQTDELACLLYSLRAQTYPHWQAVVVHDGPGPAGREVVERIGDPRIVWIETPERKATFGHPWRQLAIDRCTGDYIGLTNGDNYYVPVYFEWMLHVLTTNHADIAYCDFVTSHFRWDVIRAGPRTGRIDLGCWLARAGLVKTTPWRDDSFCGDGTYFEDLLRKADGVMHINRPLFVHN
jgi:hypothetical protein